MSTPPPRPPFRHDSSVLLQASAYSTAVSWLFMSRWTAIGVTVLAVIVIAMAMYLQFRDDDAYYEEQKAYEDALASSHSDNT